MKEKQKKINDLSALGGLVYSTNPDVELHTEEEVVEETLEPKKQMLKIELDRKIKGGKKATIVYNFVGSDEDLEALAKHLKTKCACGGAAKEGEIILQGDFREKVKKELDNLGYKYKMVGG
ncbi:MAG: translation initiation factor [Bacteroidia bacterium]